MRIGWYGVGNLDSDYIGVDGGSNIRIPLMHELVKLGHSLTWIGRTPEKYAGRNFPILDILGIEKERNIISVQHEVSSKYVSKFTVKQLNEQFDVLLLEARMNEYPEQLPDFNLQNFLIENFDGPVFVWDQDLVAQKIPQNLHSKVILLRPYVKENLLKWKNQHEFMYFTNDMTKFQNINKAVDFVYAGNTYQRLRQFEKFFGQLQKTRTAMVTGNFLRDKDRAFSLRFENILYVGQTPHYSTIPFLSAGKATIEIVKDDYETFGLQTVRIWEALMAKILCFADRNIYGIKDFVPKELIARDGKEAAEILGSLETNWVEVFLKFQDMHKNNTARQRAVDFIKIANMELNKSAS